MILSNMNLSEDKLNLLLNMAGKKLGQDPAALKSKLESGNLDGITDKMSPQAKQQISSLLQNPKGLEALLADEKVKSMIAGLMGGKK